MLLALVLRIRTALQQAAHNFHLMVELTAERNYS
jgi:hypothetical protein